MGLGKLRLSSFSLFVILLCQLSFSAYQMGDHPCHLKRDYSLTYRKEGDLVIGGFFSLFLKTSIYVDKLSFRIPPVWTSADSKYMIKHYQHFLIFQFAVHEINKDPHLLPNITLGYQLFSNFHSNKLALENSLIWLSGMGPTIPNYNCELQHKSVAVIGGMSSTLSMAMATMLGLYKVPQVTYGPFDLLLADNVQYPYVYQMGSRESTLHLTVIKLMLHFGWTWIGLVISDNMRGEQFFNNLKEEMTRNGMCLAFVERVPKKINLEHDESIKLFSRIIASSSNVIFIYGDTDSLFEFSILVNDFYLNGKLLITTSYWDFSIDVTKEMNHFHGTLIISQIKREIPGFTDFLRSVKPTVNTEDIFLKSFWEITYYCRLSKKGTVELLHYVCPEMDLVEGVYSSDFEKTIMDLSYNIYNGIYLLAHAFHQLLESDPKATSEFGKNPVLSWKLHHFLRCVNPDLDDKDELCGYAARMADERYDILNFKIFPDYIAKQVKVGEVIHHGKELNIHEEDVDWPEDFGQTPSSTCSASCGPGFRKTLQEGQPICCFDCTLCPEGEISNQSDTEQCLKCPEDQYPSKEKDRCLPKTVTYLAYEETLGMALAAVALSLSLLTTLVLGIFVMHRDTPIVKANNRSLSYTLLTSLTLCFLSSLLFIGRPTPATCLLRQTTFAIVFTVTIASILAKTITMVLAFRATKQVSKLRRLMGTRVSYFLIFICTLIQMCLCGIWLGTYPPFLEKDTHSEFSFIVIQCNEGSLVTFYCVLGYMGFLSLVSFTLAFLARKLPDTFNEAKYLTFSMMVFCSVWISFLPAYQSTKRKAMVAMEIFSILVSGAGILTCIFVPKCYVIFLRSDRNTLSLLKSKANP
ncbi:vomeronasal 2 receptor 644 isoform X1 [Monodelphis domestica]|uniref:vomeronasal 2 receptor 644 isoform X1 n=1 Tax=Monodelphis domestica TaxID=13616 RepID=UPI0024E20A5A|nr:vomeronasal 2 receptor 644 isoform X1 [Monodelphis domestica]